MITLWAVSSPLYEEHYLVLYFSKNYLPVAYGLYHWKKLEVMFTIIHPTYWIIHHIPRAVDEARLQTSCEHFLITY